MIRISASPTQSGDVCASYVPTGCVSATPVRSICFYVYPVWLGGVCTSSMYAYPVVSNGVLTPPTQTGNVSLPISYDWFASMHISCDWVWSGIHPLKQAAFTSLLFSLCQLLFLYDNHPCTRKYHTILTLALFTPDSNDPFCISQLGLINLLSCHAVSFQSHLSWEGDTKRSLV